MNTTHEKMDSKSLTIYCLTLRDGYLYVGKTYDLDRRLREHSEGKGSQWTQMHPVVGLYKKWENADDFDEDKYTKVMMKQYGIDKVRGGSYVQCELSNEQKSSLQRELFGATDACFKCGSLGHWAKNCPTRSQSHNTSVAMPAESEDVPGSLLRSALGVLGSSLSFIGKWISGDRREQFCFKCGKTDHLIQSCPIRIPVRCYTCNKEGHMSPACQRLASL